jgi:hypothetical protein
MRACRRRPGVRSHRCRVRPILRLRASGRLLPICCASCGGTRLHPARGLSEAVGQGEAVPVRRVQHLAAVVGGRRDIEPCRLLGGAGRPCWPPARRGLARCAAHCARARGRRGPRRGIAARGPHPGVSPSVPSAGALGRGAESKDVLSRFEKGSGARVASPRASPDWQRAPMALASSRDPSPALLPSRRRPPHARGPPHVIAGAISTMARGRSGRILPTDIPVAWSHVLPDIHDGALAEPAPVPVQARSLARRARRSHSAAVPVAIASSPSPIDRHPRSRNQRSALPNRERR